MRILAAWFLSSALPLVSAAAPTNLSPSTDAANPVALLSATQKDFLYTKDIAARRTAITKNSATYETLFCYGSQLKLSWTGTTGECTVSVKRLADGQVVWTGTSTAMSVEVVNLEIGAGYEWTVSCGGESASATFYTEDTPPRLIKTGEMKNMRDLGGWTGTLDGKQYKVRQNLLFRGGAADSPSPDKYLIPDDSERAFFYDVVGLKNEVDFRDFNDSKRGDISKNAKNNGTYMIDLTGTHITYSNISIENNETGSDKNPNFPKVLKLLTNPTNLPAYFHCKSGRDRTGTCAAVLLAVLGVSKDDIVRDYQTTSDKDNYETTGGYYYGGFKNFIENELGAYKDAKLSLAENVSAYLQDCGITPKEIETFRETMLEGYGEEPPVVDPEDPSTYSDLEPSGEPEISTNLTMSVGGTLTFSHRYRKNLRYWLLGSTNGTSVAVAELNVPVASCTNFVGYSSRSTIKTNEVTLTIQAAAPGTAVISLGRQYKSKQPVRAERYQILVK